MIKCNGLYTPVCIKAEFIVRELDQESSETSWLSCVALFFVSRPPHRQTKISSTFTIAWNCYPRDRWQIRVTFPRARNNFCSMCVPRLVVIVVFLIGTRCNLLSHPRGRLHQIISAQSVVYVARRSLNEVTWKLASSLTPRRDNDLHFCALSIGERWLDVFLKISRVICEVRWRPC